MNYDDQLLGVGNSFHPANQKETEQEKFNSVNLQECLDYAKETKDFEWIESAIINQNTIIEKSISELDFLIDLNHQTQNTYIKNRLIELRRNLKSNQ